MNLGWKAIWDSACWGGYESMNSPAFADAAFTGAWSGIRFNQPACRNFAWPRFCAAATLPLAGSSLQPDVLGEGRPHHAAERNRRQALKLAVVPVEAGDEHRDADAALLVDHHLHVGVHLGPPGLVGLAARGHQQLVELLALPARLVPGRIGL